ncbi:MAG: phosphotransferase [Clostridiales bacterium]|jgi:Ser/Thr protein kinase RdoA (MazF antagonist)|nr:phosphotransferase [Clostridiales bacterium]
MLNEALSLYEFENPVTEFIRHNENLTYKVTDGEKKYLLRFHKPTENLNMHFFRMGKTVEDLANGEIQIRRFLAKKGNVKAQQAILNKHGNAVSILEDKTIVTVLEWLDGEILVSMPVPDSETAEKIAFEMGIIIGKMHNDFSGLTLNNRYVYDAALLEASIDEMKSFKRGTHDRQINIIIETLKYIRDYFHGAANRLTLTHGDFNKTNIIYNNGSFALIDFSLSGYSLPETDLSMALIHSNDEVLNRKILSGYQSVCKIEIDFHAIEVCHCWNPLLFLVLLSKPSVNEEWIINNQPHWNEKIQNWCDNLFLPLLNGKTRDVCR